MLTVTQVEALVAPLDAKRVRQKQGQSHLEAWDIRRHLIRVFGWGGWDLTVLSCDCILERSFWSDKPNEPFKGRHTVAYRVTMRLTIKDVEGNELAHFEDGAVGDSQNQPSLADAHDMALKTAMSQALKRCAINLGDRYGLSLYNKGATGAVVGKSLAHEHEAEHEASERVEGGELDEQPEQADSPESPEPAATLANAESHEKVRDQLATLTTDQLAEFGRWRRREGLPGFKDEDSLTVPQAAAVLDEIARLIRDAAASEGVSSGTTGGTSPETFAAAGEGADQAGGVDAPGTEPAPSGPAAARDALKGKKALGATKKARSNTAPSQAEAVDGIKAAFPGTEEA